MCSFEKFKETLLNQFNVELSEYKEELNCTEDEIMKNSIKSKEIDKKIKELDKSKDDSLDIFSPSEHSEDFNLLEINRLKDESEKIKNTLDEDKDSKSALEKKIKDKQKIIQIVEKYNVSKREVTHQNEIKKCIEKLEFCKKICITDANRCKLEIDEILKILLNVSRET